MSIQRFICVTMAMTGLMLSGCDQEAAFSVDGRWGWFDPASCEQNRAVTTFDGTRVSYYSDGRQIFAAGDLSTELIGGDDSRQLEVRYTQRGAIVVDRYAIVSNDEIRFLSQQRDGSPNNVAQDLSGRIAYRCSDEANS